MGRKGTYGKPASTHMVFLKKAVFEKAVFRLQPAPQPMLVLQATGFGFGLNIAASVYSLLAGLIAGIKRDIPTHKRHIIRMIGLAYGVFPTKYIWVLILAMSNTLRGEWVYPVSVWLSTVTGVLVTEWALLGKLSAEDKAHDRSHINKQSVAKGQ